MTVNVPAVPTVKVVWSALVMAGGLVTVSVKVWVASVLAPLLAVMVIGKTPAAVGVPARVAVPSPLSVKRHPGRQRAGLGDVVAAGNPAVVVTVKLPAVPTAKVAWSALVITGEALAGTTVRVNACCGGSGGVARR